jgi:single-stranded DNA-binding protein
MNTVTITGRFTADPEMKIKDDGFGITEGLSATNPRVGGL